MPDYEIVHPVPAEEIVPFMVSLGTTFLEDTGPDSFRRQPDAVRRSWDPQLRWGARADGRWVGTLGTFSDHLTIPGTGATTSELPVDALTMVSVAATHRRRGILTHMLTESLRVAKERGDVASVLIAAEWPIYGRFGYAPAERIAHYVLSTRVPGGAVPWTGDPHVREVEPEELAKVAPALFDHARRQRSGNITRSAAWWDQILGVNGLTAQTFGARTRHAVVHEGPDGVDGYCRWAPTKDFDIDGTPGGIAAVEVAAATGTAYREIWQYLSNMDVSAEVEMRWQPIDIPLRWLLPDGRALRQSYTGDGIWLRLLDLPAALATRRYACEGRLVLQVEDPAGLASGCVLLEGGPDGATCTPTSAPPDLRLAQRALAAAYLGGYSLHDQVPSGLVEEVASGALARADAMLATPLAPWSMTRF